MGLQSLPLIKLWHSFPGNLELNYKKKLRHSKDGAKNLALMTKTVIEGKTKNEPANPIRFPTDFKNYLKNQKLFEKYYKIRFIDKQLQITWCNRQALLIKLAELFTGSAISIKLQPGL